MLDNPMPSDKVAHDHEERIFKVEIVPNPFGGVNTHLWSNEAYIVGIVPVVRPVYSPPTRNGKVWRERDWLLGSVFRDRTWRATEQEILKHEHKHEVEDGDISPLQRRR